MLVASSSTFSPGNMATLTTSIAVRDFKRDREWDQTVLMVRAMETAEAETEAAGLSIFAFASASTSLFLAMVKATADAGHEIVPAAAVVISPIAIIFGSFGS